MPGIKQHHMSGLPEIHSRVDGLVASEARVSDAVLNGALLPGGQVVLLEREAVLNLTVSHI